MRTFRTYALIDSGADHCIFPKAAADQIGIVDITTGRYLKSHGIGGGGIDCYFHEVRMCVGGHWLTFDVAFSADHNGPPLLGRLGFFDNFTVYIDHPKQRIELEKVEKRK